MNNTNYKKGDKVICIRNDGGYENSLTIGESYKVMYIDKIDGAYHVQVKSDDFDEGRVTVFLSRFISTTEYKKIQRKEKLENINNLLSNEF